jgi:hypothetical protein
LLLLLLLLLLWRPPPKNLQVDMSLGAANPLRAVRQLVPWHRQYKVLLARAIKEQFRCTTPGEQPVRAHTAHVPV